MPTQLTNLRIEEVSSVDRGAGQGVKVMLMKREFSQDERDNAADSGAALPDGSFPIKTKDDLRNAIHAIGRAKDRARALAHIKERARALGATDMLPDDWQKRHDAQEQPMPNIADLMKSLDEAVAAEIAKMTPKHAEYHGNLDGDEAKRFAAMSHDDREKYCKEHPIKVQHATEPDADDAGGPPDGDEDDTEKAAKAFLDALAKSRKAKAKPVDEEKIRGDHDDGARHGPPGTQKRDTEDDEVKKIDELKAENVELRKRVDALAEKDKQVEFSKRAAALGLPEADGAMLLKAHRGDPEALKWMEDKIGTLQTQVNKGKLFDEFGASGGGGAVTAHDELVAKAAEIRKSEPKLTAEQAYTKAMEQNPEIAKREAVERHSRIHKAA